MVNIAVTKKSNLAVHCLQFSSIVQSDEESIKDYVIRLNSVLPKYKCECRHCQYNLSTIQLKDQFIQGIQNKSLKTDILTLLENVVKC